MKRNLNITSTTELIQFYFYSLQSNLSICFLVTKFLKSKFFWVHQVLSFCLLRAFLFQITKPFERLSCFPFCPLLSPLPPLPQRNMLSFGISVSQAIQLLKQTDDVDNHKEFAKKLTFQKSFSNNLCIYLNIKCTSVHSWQHFSKVTYCD